MNKLGKPSLFKASLLAALLAVAWGAQAAGLGKLTVYSAIGQPLSADLAITATPEELTSLSAKLPSHDAFKEAGIEFMPALAGLRFSVVKRPDNGQPVLRLTTERPLNEPFLHFLVELNWAAGRMVREYTFLLDPPEMLQAAKPAVVAPVAPPVPAAVVVPQGLPAASAKASPPPESVTARVRPPVHAAPPVEAPAPAVERVVKVGDTLGKIARESASESVSLDQMLVALFNSNRDAFDGNNMNRLRAGKILRLPDPAEAAKVDAGEARKLVVGQAADFNVYRRRLADAAAMAPTADTAPRQQVAGKIKPQVDGNVPSAPAKDKLEVSRTEIAKAAKAEGKGSLEEDLIAREKALREASDRIVQLEKNLENLKRLVELKSQSGAEMQQQAQAVASPKPAEIKKPAPVVQPVEAVKPAEVAKPVEVVKPVETAKPVEAEKTVEAAKPVAESAAVPAPVAQPDSPKPAVKPPVRKPVAPPPPPPPLPEPSFIEENPEIVFGGGGLIALLLGYFGYSAWRKKKQLREDAEFADEPGISAGDPGVKSGAVFGAVSESVDSGEVSIQGDFSEGGVLTTEESVDPVAEADVYMAYGRDGQAEEILLEGLKDDPTRGAIHLKLLELYANRKNIAQFESVARQLNDLSGGQGADWAKAVALASALGVTGGVFAAATSVPAATPAPAATIMPAAADHEDAMPAVAATEASEAIGEEVSTPTADGIDFIKAAQSPAEADAGSLDFDLDLGTSAEPAAAGMTEQPEPMPASEEAMSLDFDFDLGAPEPAASPALVEMPAVTEPAAPEAADDNAIDFSLDIDTSDATPLAVEKPIAAVSAVDDGNGMDFDLDLGSVGTEAAPVDAIADVGDMTETGIEIDFPSDDHTSAASVPEQASSGGLSDLKLDFDLELDAAAPASQSALASATLDLADISLDLDEPGAVASTAKEILIDEVSLPEVALPADDLAPAVADANANVPDDDFDLMLDVGDMVPEAQSPAAGVTPPSLPDIDLPSPLAVSPPVGNEVEPLASLPDLDLDAEPAGEPGAGGASAGSDSKPDDPEVATKLELAQAYEEMGDREGARELLNEVLNEGSLAQQALARTRLDQLDV